MSTVTVPLFGAVHLNQIDFPPALPAWLGSPVSFVALTVVPVAVPASPVMEVAPAKLSFVKAWVPRTAFQSSIPLTPSFAEKNRVPPTLVSEPGDALALPALMFRTRVVPVAVPLLCHNSWPRVPSSATKNKVVPTAVSFSGNEPAMPGSDVLDRRRAGRGPVALPELEPAGSVVRPEEQCPADVHQPPLGWGSLGCDDLPLGVMSFTSVVPSAVPSLRQSSRPLLRGRQRRRTRFPRRR